MSLTKLFLAGNTSAVDFRNGRFQEKLKFQNIPGQEEFNQQWHQRIPGWRALIDIFNSVFFILILDVPPVKSEEQGGHKEMSSILADR